MVNLQLVIKPSSSLEVPVIFKPSKFGDQHDGEIIFTSKEVTIVSHNICSMFLCSLASNCSNLGAMDYTLL